MTYYIPNDATNGDILKLMFPKLLFDEDEYFEVVKIEKDLHNGNIESIGTLSLDWWNETYKINLEVGK